MEKPPADINDDDLCMDPPEAESPIKRIIKELDGKIMADEAAQQKLKFRVPVPDRIKTPNLLTPKDLYESLSRDVIGQDTAKKALSVALYSNLYIKSDSDTKSPNLLLVGPSGCGKTHTAKALSKVCGLPFLKIDATSFVTRGYRGGAHVEQVIDFLISSAGGSIKKAEKSIVFIDEIDKIAANPHDDGDISTTGVQKDLLGILDGGDFFYEPDHSDYDRLKFSFKDVMFIFGGTFEKRKSGVHDIEDLVLYGFLPEFANRLGNIVHMEELEESAIRQITKKAVSSYKSIAKLSQDEITVVTELIMLQVMSKKLHKMMGARCVAPAVRAFFEDRLFNI